MPRRKATTRERSRAVAAVRMREAGKTYEEIRVALNYRTVGAVKMAVSRLLARNEVESVADYRRVHGARLERLLRACWDKACAGDAEAIRTARPLLDSIAKLHGLDAAMQIHVRAGISSEQFAEQAAAMLAVTGDRPLLELAAPVLPPWQRAALFAEPVDPEPDPEWSNIGMGVDAEDIEPEAVAEPAVVVAERSQPEPEAEEIEAELVEDEPGGCGCGTEAEVIVLEPLPRSQFRVPAAQVWGRSVNPYDPLRGWRPR